MEGLWPDSYTENCASYAQMGGQAFYEDLAI